MIPIVEMHADAIVLQPSRDLVRLLQDANSVIVTPVDRNHDHLDRRQTRRDDNPNAWVIYEEWESKGHHERYIQWRTDTGFFEMWGPMMHRKGSSSRSSWPMGMGRPI